MATFLGQWFLTNGFRYYTLPLILWTVIMMILSTIPGSGIPEISLIQWDKIAHFTEFVVFSFLLGRFLYFRKNVNLKKSLILIVLIAISYSILDELHQLFVPFRDCSAKDLLADILGVFTGMAGFKFIAVKDIVVFAKNESIQ